MKRFIGAIILLSAWHALHSGRAFAQAPQWDPANATVRIKSHGCSGTIIATTQGKSWILTCAHQYLDNFGRSSKEARERVIRIDGPPQPAAPQKRAPARLLAYDHDLDLSLIEIDNGPFFFVPVAAAGHKTGRLLSLGYDEMKWPVTQKAATLKATSAGWTYTVEKPWHGRSGGGLIDLDARALVGVCHGYEMGPGARGIYVGHQAILAFVKKHFPAGNAAPDPAVPYSVLPRGMPRFELHRSPRGPPPGC
jgi:hypothetical protein